MPVRSEDRTTVNLGQELILAARQRAEEEGQEFSALVALALRQYLRGPAKRPEDALPGLPPEGSDLALRDEVRVLSAEIRKLQPQVAAVAQGHAEVMDSLDQIASELGRRNGAALALEQIRAAVTPAAKPRGS
jgi:hypothetical protein